MKMPRFLGPVQSLATKVTPWVVFVGLALAMLFDPGRETLGVASAAFAASLAMAAVSFSYARTLKEGSAARDELVFAGERLVCGAILFLVASVLRYAANDVPRYADFLFRLAPRDGAPTPDVTIFGVNGFGLMIASVAFMFFLLGLIYAQMGMGILAATASHRAKRRPGSEDYFASGKAVQERLAALDQAERAPEEKSNGVAVVNGHQP
jgi:Na+-transporting methylmalonyl-CoA/oxaloacetate decarboxylase gamma subunit